MDREEKRRLKKMGKQIVAERSNDLQELLRKANPAPIGSNDWASNYREATIEEQAIRAAPPNRLVALELHAQFLTSSTQQDMPAELFGVQGMFWERLECFDVVNSLPSETIRCTCGNVSLDMDAGKRLFRKPELVRLVKLIAKASGAPVRKPWWKFW